MRIVDVFIGELDLVAQGFDVGKFHMVPMPPSRHRKRLSCPACLNRVSGGGGRLAVSHPDIIPLDFKVTSKNVSRQRLAAAVGRLCNLLICKGSLPPCKA